jgi:hypothetical protein
MALKNWGVASLKKLTLFLWKDLKTSLVLILGLRFIPLKVNIGEDMTIFNNRLPYVKNLYFKYEIEPRN